MTTEVLRAARSALDDAGLRGSFLVRDLDTGAWQLLVATPMNRAGYLLAKWCSHMAVFALLLAAGVAVGIAAQLVRGEVPGIDLVELLLDAEGA